MGQVLQFQGDQRENVMAFLLDNRAPPSSRPQHRPGRRLQALTCVCVLLAEICEKDKIKKHGHG